MTPKDLSSELEALRRLEDFAGVRFPVIAAAIATVEAAVGGVADPVRRELARSVLEAPSDDPTLQGMPWKLCPQCGRFTVHVRSNRTRGRVSLECTWGPCRWATPTPVPDPRPRPPRRRRQRRVTHTDVSLPTPSGGG